MLTIGGGLGSLIGAAAISLLPTAGIDIRVAAVVGMAGLFGGASRALLTSIVFAFETTQQPACLLPLLGGCVAAYLVSCLLMRTTIMTEKIVRRGISVPNEYIPDHLSNISLAAVAIKPVVSIKADDTLGTVRAWLRSHRPEAEHQGYPVLNSKGRLIGVVTRRNLLNPEIEDSQLVSSTIQTAPIVIASSATLRDAADEMVRRGVGRLPIVDSRKSDALIGIITRSDLLSAHQTRIHEHEHIERTIRLRPMKRLMIRNLQRKRRLATVTIARDVAQPSETPTDKTG
jgi:CBS domain-containing protein